MANTSIKLRINHELGTNGKNTTNLPDSIYQIGLRSTVTDIYYNTQKIKIIFGYDQTSEKELEIQYFPEFLKQNSRNIMFSRKTSEIVKEILSKPELTNLKIVKVELNSDLRIDCFYENGNVTYFTVDKTEELPLKIKYLIDSSKDKFTNKGYKSLKEAYDIVVQNIKEAEILKRRIKNAERNQKLKEKREEKKAEKQVLEMFTRAEVQRQIEHASKRWDRKYEIKQKEEYDNLKKIIEIQNEKELEFDDECFDEIVDEIVYKKQPGKRVIDEDAIFEDAIKFKHNEDNRKYRFKQRYFNAVSEAMSYGVEFTGIKDSFKLLNIDTEWEQYQLREYNKIQAHQDRVDDIKNLAAKHVDKISLAASNELKELMSIANQRAGKILKEFKLSNHHMGSDKMREIKIDKSKIKSELSKRTESAIKKTKTQYNNKTSPKGYQKIGGTYFTAIIPSRTIRLENGEVENIPSKKKRIGVMENVYRNPKLIPIQTPKYFIRSGIIDSMYSDVLAAAFFQILVSNTPIDEDYQGYETRYVIRGFSKIHYTDDYSVTKDKASLSDRQFSSERDALKAISELVVKRDRDKKKKSLKIFKFEDEIEDEANEKLYVKKIKVKKYHKADSDVLRNCWVLRYKGLHFKVSDFYERCFDKKMDENSILIMAKIIHKATKDKGVKNTNFTYYNTNEKWEYLEYGYYTDDSGPFIGAKYKHGVKNHHSYQAPKGYVRLTEALWNEFASSGRQYQFIADFLNDYKTFDVSDLDGSELMQNLINSDASIRDDVYDTKNWKVMK